MASCSEQFLKVSRNSVQWSQRSSGLEIGRDGRTDERTDGHKDHYIPPQLRLRGYHKYTCERELSHCQSHASKRLFVCSCVWPTQGQRRQIASNVGELVLGQCPHISNEVLPTTGTNHNDNDGPTPPEFSAIRDEMIQIQVLSRSD